MDRPLSAASSTAAPSTFHPGATTASHTRNASIKNVPQPAGLSAVQLFLTNLRLLNLDILPDWPNITSSSFGNHDARIRIKCCEYALYQLFRLSDPQTAADKLQPFFPPLEPLQSVNLRAALYRCLSDLKKAGVLPRDTVLRKSMLDDCQGDKFWDVCLSFSAVVLRKATVERKAKHGRPVAERIGTAQGLSRKKAESMLPLAIAHKAALSKVLAERNKKRETYARLHHVLLEKGQEVRERTVQSSQELQKTKTLPRERANAIEDAIEKNWVGSAELKDALIDGDTCAKGDGILVESFDQLWKQNGEEELTVSNGADVGLLQSLSSRATQQSVRLRMWQNYLDRLVAAKPTAQASHTPSEAQKPTLRFNKHRDISLNDDSPDEDEERSTPPRRHPSSSRYDAILTAMREELRRNTAHRTASQPTRPSISPLKRAQTQPITIRKAGIPLDAVAGAPNLHARSVSQTAVPMHARMGRRVSSQSKTYEKPKVDGQREPIPLKSELFSPLKEDRRSSRSFASTVSTLLETTEDGESSDAMANVKDDTDAHDIGTKYETDSGVDLRTGNSTRRTSVDDTSSTRSSTSVDDLRREIRATDADFKIPDLPTNKQIVRPSLIERTRMSIAFNSSEDIGGFLPDRERESAGSASRQGKDDETIITDVPSSFDRRSSLLDRTRDSMSKLPPRQDTHRSEQSSHKRSRSSLYPVNQFETPRKARSSTIGANNIRRNATPVEQLLSPDAEYESVFKARPKIALSPVISPYRDADLNENGALELEGGASSPLVDVGTRR